MRIPANGFVFAYLRRIDIKPGISGSATIISFAAPFGQLHVGDFIVAAHFG